MTTFKDMREVKKANKARGKFWFSPATLQWFNSKVESELIGGRYFVTSEHENGEPKRYSIREVDSDVDIETVGEFGQYQTAAQALVGIGQLMKGGE